MAQQQDGGSRDKIVLLLNKTAWVHVFLLALSTWTVWNYTTGTSRWMTTISAPLYENINRCERELKIQDRSTLLSYRQSYGFFDDIPDEEWVTIKQKVAREAQHYEYEASPLQNFTSVQSWIISNQLPVFSCPHVLRVGGFEDGAKWTCDPYRLKRIAAERKSAHDKHPTVPKDIKTDNSVNGTVQSENERPRESYCLVYSIGSSGNYLFEEGLYRLLGGPICEIHIFDFGEFAKDEKYLKERNFHYHKWGLKSSAQTDDAVRYNMLVNPNNAYTFYSFDEIQKKLGHENRTIDIFKIDCEGCEWQTFQDWINVDIRQILIETHNLPAMPATRYFNAFEQHGFVMFYKELNGYGLNCCSEWSYVKLHQSFLDETWETPESVDLLDVAPGIDAARKPVMDFRMRRQFETMSAADWKNYEKPPHPIRRSVSQSNFSHSRSISRTERDELLKREIARRRRRGLIKDD